MPRQFWIETLGCPKNQVDSEKIAGTLLADGLERAGSAASADLVVVNTCAFIEAAREESIETILALAAERQRGSQLVVTGCLAARAGEELAESMPEVDLVADVGVPVNFSGGPRFRRRSAESSRANIDFLDLPRPAATSPWAYVKVAEGCDRNCGFCAIPSFRGKQRSRSVTSILEEVDALEAKEIVLVAQDLASYGRDIGTPGALIPLTEAVADRVDRVRLVYPSSLNDALIATIVDRGLAYFDLSLQHVSGGLLRRMRRYGDGDRFLRRIDAIRERAPHATFRSSFILGYPGETEDDHDALLDFLQKAELDWAGFFTFSKEAGTYAADLGDQVPNALAWERLREVSAMQDEITARRRRSLVGELVEVLIDTPGVGRSQREAPEIDGVITVDDQLPVGTLQQVLITDAIGPDLQAVPVASRHGSQVGASLR